MPPKAVPVSFAAEVAPVASDTVASFGESQVSRFVIAASDAVVEIFVSVATAAA